ncbi:hypothetical protein KUCAC02_017063, partial [Chaenocephalus aceratus]
HKDPGDSPVAGLQTGWHPQSSFFILETAVVSVTTRLANEGSKDSSSSEQQGNIMVGDPNASSCVKSFRETELAYIQKHSTDTEATGLPGLDVNTHMGLYSADGWTLRDFKSKRPLITRRLSRQVDSQTLRIKASSDQ